MKNRRRWNLEPGILEESREVLRNPARGWYEIYSFQAGHSIDFDELKWSLRKMQTMALVLFDIGAYRDIPLDETALEELQQILAFFSNYRKDVILQPVYDREGHGEEREPESFSLVQIHLRQIAELVGRTEHSICVFQGLLIGSWGEMHHSRYLSAEHLRLLYQEITPCLGEFPLAVRTSAQWRMLIGTEEDGEKKEKEDKRENLTLFDDAIFGSLTHMGTFGTMTREAAGWEQPWSRREELDFIWKKTKHTLCGGEAIACQAEERSWSADEVISELQMLHASYLNGVYDGKRLEEWKHQPCGQSGIWAEASLHAYIESHLGYRLLVRNVTQNMHFGGKMTVTAEIENTGFGAVVQESELYLVCMQTGSEGEFSEKRISEREVSEGDVSGSKIPEREFPISYDIRTLLPGTKVEISVDIKRAEGTFFLRLRRKKDGRPMYFANKNSADGVCLFRLHR